MWLGPPDTTLRLWSSWQLQQTELSPTISYQPGKPCGKGSSVLHRWNSSFVAIGDLPKAVWTPFLQVFVCSPLGSSRRISNSSVCAVAARLSSSHQIITCCSGAATMANNTSFQDDMLPDGEDKPAGAGIELNFHEPPDWMKAMRYSSNMLLNAGLVAALRTLVNPPKLAPPVDGSVPDWFADEFKEKTRGRLMAKQFLRDTAAFAAGCMVFDGVSSVMSYMRGGKEDPWNKVMGGVSAGGVLSLVCKSLGWWLPWLGMALLAAAGILAGGGTGVGSEGTPPRMAVYWAHMHGDLDALAPPFQAGRRHATAVRRVPGQQPGAGAAVGVRRVHWVHVVRGRGGRQQGAPDAAEAAGER